MVGNADASITLDAICAVVAARRVPVAPELAGYLVLEIAEGMDPNDGEIDPRQILVSEEGTVAVVRGRGEGGGNTGAEASLRHLLASFLEASGSQTPALTAAARRKPGAGVRALAAEIEAALIPVNRAAGRRALARLARESRRVTLGVGRNALGPRVSSPSHADALPHRSDPSMSRGRSVESANDGLPMARTGGYTSPVVSGSDPAPEAPRLPTPRPPTASSPALGAYGNPYAPPEPPRIDPTPAPDAVESLLADFSLSGPKGDREIARELSSMVGIPPSLPPPAAPSGDVDAAVEALLGRSDQPPAVRSTEPRASGSGAPATGAHAAVPKFSPAPVAPTPAPRGTGEFGKPRPLAPSSASWSLREKNDESEGLSPVRALDDEAPMPQPRWPSVPHGEAWDVGDEERAGPDAGPDTDRGPSTPPPPFGAGHGPAEATERMPHLEEMMAHFGPESDAPLGERWRGRWEKLRTDLPLLRMAAAGLGLAGVVLFFLKMHFASPTTVAPETVVDGAASSGATVASLCRARAVLSDAPVGAEVLVRRGQAPLELPRIPVGPRHEFVALQEGFAPKRAAIPPGSSQWEAASSGQPRFELAVQLDPFVPKEGATAPWPAMTNDPGAGDEPQGPPGTVRIVSAPRGAEIFQGAPRKADGTVTVEQLPCQEPMDILVVTPGTEPMRRHIEASAFQRTGTAGPGLLEQREARISLSSP